MATRHCCFPSSDHLLTSLEVDIRKGRFVALNRALLWPLMPSEPPRPAEAFQSPCSCRPRVLSAADALSSNSPLGPRGTASSAAPPGPCFPLCARVPPTVGPRGQCRVSEPSPSSRACAPAPSLAPRVSVAAATFRASQSYVSCPRMQAAYRGGLPPARPGRSRHLTQSASCSQRALTALRPLACPQARVAPAAFFRLPGTSPAGWRVLESSGPR